MVGESQRHIVVLANSVLSGDATGKHVCDVARALVSSGYRVTVCYDGTWTRNDDFVRSMSKAWRPGDSLPECDILLVEYAGWYALSEAIATGNCKTIFWYHGVTPPEMWGADVGREGQEWSLLKTGLAHYADATVACSPFGARELSQSCGIAEDSVQVIPLCIDTQSCAQRPPQQELERLRRRLGAAGSALVLYVGRLAPNKRVDLLIEAFDIVRRTIPNVTLVVVGDDRSTAAYVQQAEHIRQMIRELGLTERVVITGKVRAVEPYYHLADVLVLPSAHEGFGAPLVEAMAAGVPVVAANAGAMPWVIGAETASPAGLLFESGSAPSLAEAMLSVLSDDHTAELLRTRGKERAASFGPERFCQAVSELVEQVEKSARRRKPGGEPHRSARDRADVALRGYRVTSHVPVFGRAIEWIRTNMTSHLKEAYVDRIVERQVMYNLALVNEVDALSTQLAQQAERLGELKSELMEISRLLRATRQVAPQENVNLDDDRERVD